MNKKKGKAWYWRAEIDKVDDSDLVAQKKGGESGSYQDVRLHGSAGANCRSLSSAFFFLSLFAEKKKGSLLISL